MVEEFIIQGIKNKYEIEYKTTKALNDAEEMIENYFNELNIYIRDIKETLNEKVMLKVNENNIIAELKMENDYIRFERHADEIKVYMSNCSEEDSIYTTIKPSEDFRICKYKGLTFGYGDINEIVRIAFNIKVIRR